MTKIRKLGVIAVATLLSALSLPRSSSAQGGPPQLPPYYPPGQEYGSYSGFDTYEISEYVSNQRVASYSGGGPATLTLGVGYMEIGPIFGQGGYFTPYAQNPPFFDPFGPTSTAGSFGANYGPGGFASGNFFLT
jgi:hypothetical protein